VERKPGPAKKDSEVYSDQKGGYSSQKTHGGRERGSRKTWGEGGGGKRGAGMGGGRKRWNPYPEERRAVEWDFRSETGTGVWA